MSISGTKKAEIKSIAVELLGLETLEVRNSDSLDFHDLHVVSIQDALEQAFDAGVKAATELAHQLRK
jgi:acyl carrier protein